MDMDLGVGLGMGSNSMEEVANSESLALILNVPIVILTCSTMAGPLVKRLFCCQGNP